MSDIALLRKYLNDPDPEEDGSGTVFTDTQLTELITLHDDDVNAAASAGWAIKAANVADWYQASADGSGLSRHQVFDHCLKMVDLYDKRSSGQISSVLMSSKTDTVDSEFA